MKIETVPIESLHQDPANVRTHDDRNIEAIAASLKRFGQQRPLVVGADGLIVAGNGTLEAAKRLGWAEVQVTRTGLEGVERVAYAIADNRTAELAAFDEDALGRVLAEIEADPSIDASVTGFDEQEILNLIEQRLPLGADGQEFDESIADDVQMATCPKCGERFPI